MSWTTWLPMLFQVVSWFLQRSNASAATIAKFQEFVQQTKDDGLISVEASDKFKSIHDKLLNDFKQKENP